MKITRKSLLKTSFLILLLGFCSLFFAQKIILHTADLGRFIQNGHQLVNGNFSVLYENAYSYTMPKQPFINHHWGVGLIYYGIWKIGGFTALSLFNLSLLSGSLLILFFLARRISTTWMASLTLLATLPLWAQRSEIRPESISIFLLSIVLSICFLNRGRANKSLFLLPLIILIWVNCHIFFILGLGVIAAFTAHAYLNGNKKGFKLYLIVGALSLIATVINPNFIHGMLAPLTIFTNYGYTVVENQSIFFMQNRFHDWLYLYVEILTGLISVLILGITINRIPCRKWLFPTLILVFFVILAFKVNRAISLLGFVSIPMIPFLAQSILKYGLSKLRWIGILSLTCLFLIGKFAFSTQAFNPIKRNFGIGLVPQSFALGQFIQNVPIKGPIFNNYDIGGYLIFSAFPKYPVFVDNRPEAYSRDFFQKIYIPMQENDTTWTQIDGQLQFNSIIFFRHDRTPWAQPFLIRRLHDPNWIPIYVDAFSLILVKNIPDNAEIISKYKIPDSVFYIRENK